MATQCTVTVVSADREYIASNGQSLFQTVAAGEWRYFVFYPTARRSVNGSVGTVDDVGISVAAYSGDIDVVITLGGDHVDRRPNGTVYDLAMRVNAMDAIKSQSLSIPIDPARDDHAICNFTTNRCAPIHIAVTPNVSDSGSGDIAFSLMVTQSATAILSDGVSVPGAVSLDGGQRLFRFIVDEAAVDTVQITVSAVSPNDNVFVTVFPSGSTLDGTRNVTKWMYSASETILFRNVSAQCIHPTSTTMCTLLVAVEMVDGDGDGDDGQSFAFNVVAASGRAFRTLQDGVTVTDSITRRGSFKYYNFYVNLNADDFAIDETVLEIDVDPVYGDPDLYIGLDLAGDHVVNTTVWRWRSRRFGRDVVAIPMVCHAAPCPAML